MTSRRDLERAAREERLHAIRRCDRCDPCGWQLGPDCTPLDPAIRCGHGTPTAPATPAAVRDITEPI